MKSCELTNTFTTRKIHEIACLIEKEASFKISKNIETILNEFESLEDIYKFLLEKSNEFKQKNAYRFILTSNQLDKITKFM
jgi:lysyl-tRNA synthetase class I